jgi:hypothetical protein
MQYSHLSLPWQLKQGPAHDVLLRYVSQATCESKALDLNFLWHGMSSCKLLMMQQCEKSVYRVVTVPGLGT